MICAEPLNATRAQLSKQVNKAIWGSSYLSTPKFMDINKNALKRNTVVVYFCEHCQKVEEEESMEIMALECLRLQRKCEHDFPSDICI